MKSKITSVDSFDSLHADTVFEALGIRVESYEQDAVVVALDVDKRHLQHAGIVHGGIYVLLSESAASISAALRVDTAQYDVFGMEINANHLKPVQKGILRAQATCVHQGRTSMVFTVNITDGEGQLISVGRCTIAIRKRK